MIAVGMNPFINAQGYSLTLVCFPLQSERWPIWFWIRCLSLCWDSVCGGGQWRLFLSFIGSLCSALSYRKSGAEGAFLRSAELAKYAGYAKEIVSLGTAGFITQLTNSLVTICCNHVLSATGGDIYISVMTIVSSVRQLVETPISAINDGSSRRLQLRRAPSARVRESGAW